MSVSAVKCYGDLKDAVLFRIFNKCKWNDKIIYKFSCFKCESAGKFKKTSLKV